MPTKISHTVEPRRIPAIGDVHLPGIFGNFHDVVDAKIAELESTSSEGSVALAEFYRYLRKEVDVEGFSDIQRRYLTDEHIRFERSDGRIGRDFLKYIDPIHWFASKFAAARRLGLHDSPPLQILDIGTGCGHFPVVARFFGHGVLGIDLPPSPNRQGHDAHFYNAIRAVYGVEKIDHGIEPFGEFGLERRFDLVTSFMSAFNVMEDKTPYTIDAWKFFFRNLRENVLTRDGRVFLALTRGKTTEEAWKFLKSKADWSDDALMYLLIEDVDSVFAESGREATPSRSAAAGGTLLKRTIRIAKSTARDGQPDTARALFEAVLAEDRDNLEAHRGLARLDTADGCGHDAIAHWQKVMELRPDIAESSLRLGRLYRADGRHRDALEAYRAHAAHDPEHAETVKAVRELETLERDLGDGHAQTLQHVAIAGVSYCGSTLLARLLGSLNGVENVGESHWLVNKKDAGSGTDVDFDADDDADIVHCFACGNDCDRLTRDFRRELQADRHNWYFRIGERLGCDTLVSADKNHAKLVALDPALRMDAIVLFKSPLQAWYSNYRKTAAASDSMSPITDLEKYLDVWATSYTRFLERFDTRGDKLFLDFESFCEQPDLHMGTMAELLDLDFDGECRFDPDSNRHCFGGNSGLNRDLRDPTKAFAIRRLGPVELPPEHVAAIEAHAGVQAVYRRMLERYRQDFGVVDPEVAESIETVLKDLSSLQTVIDSKRTTFHEAAMDAERRLRTRLRKLESSGRHGDQAAITRRLLDTGDWPAYRSLQRKYLQAESVRFHTGFVKYLNLDYWFDAKYRIAESLGLANAKPMRILDIGAGPGHFPLVCTLLGHGVTCTDIDVTQTGSWGDTHLYDALIEHFGQDRRVHRIEPFTAMPSFGERFDLITGLMIKFNVSPTGTPWGTDEWDFFLDDIARNQLARGGRLFLKMNMTGCDTSVEYIDEKVLELFRHRDAVIDLKRSTVEFPALTSSQVVAA